ncbi:tRNA (adenine(22)-N(1))-methyltransferase [Clostridium acetireducens DSM 10703]|jgi:tRNA (adenine22-N1)-methyltransferase|uniref:tRNA (Adenine(22)-N(1))-methyltransferase n=1 Tax=Clostridium acetireducens DSM 10703 TaxID=1121290 RepID=A0A1E8F127_9CLOT|nr:class I SAM-dependent methyltransferase [Clostridium acetireducens]OFI07167.1 tRNA (adenine(22)-N(1))-methyltransferase [Clostridium acetireducens DSM 10703]
MEISLRLEKIALMVDKCYCCADIGTDHGYIPVYLLKNNICIKSIASDINKLPLEKAMRNINNNYLEKSIECRLGSGLNTLKIKEAQGVIIAGMGGNLIKDIIEERIDIFKHFDFAVLQPVQNPEVLRKYIYEKGFDILDEELCIDENKFYEIIKVKYNTNKREKDDIYYEISDTLLKKKHPLLKEYINEKINKYNKILEFIKEDTKLASNRKKEINCNIQKLKELLVKCL